MSRIGKVVLLMAAFTMSLCGCGTTPSDGGNTPNKPSDYPLYVENYNGLTYSADDYAQKIAQPYWLGNVMYNEIALPVEYESGECYAKLLYKPLKVVSVYNRELNKQYVEGTDYTVDAANKRIIITANSSIPKWQDGIDEGKNVPEEFTPVQDWTYLDWEDKYLVWNPTGKGNFVYAESPVFYGKYLSITYCYDTGELPENIFSSFDKMTLTKIRRKLKNKQKITLAVLGDSITEGCSSTSRISEVLGREVLPNTPCYAELLAYEIRRYYGVEVELHNEGIGGDTSSDVQPNGKHAAALNSAKAAKPDLCVIGFGMNDMSNSNSAAYFGTNIKALINEIRSSNSECEFILLNSFPCNPLYELDSDTFTGYLRKLNEIAQENEDGSVAVVDMQKVGKHALQTKRYCEISSSNVNHPNDFFHRVYSMNIMAVLGDYKK